MAFRPGENMAVGFVALDRRINRDTEALHDFLWHGEKKDEKSLIRSLRNDARAADVFLQLGGHLRTNTDELAESLQPQATGNHSSSCCRTLGASAQRRSSTRNGTTAAP